MRFRDFPFTPSIFESLEAMRFETPTPVQEKVIPLALEGKDVIAVAQTGTGKTASYLLPVIQHLEQGWKGGINTLILAPTRELALQIDQQIQGFAYFSSFSCIAVYGGSDGAAWDQQKSALLKGAEIVVATPGRILSHLNFGYLDFGTLQHLILDEADRMLDMGFFEDIMRIVNTLPANRQTMLFSATMPPRIRELARKIMINPAAVDIAISKPADGITQEVFFLRDHQKIRILDELFKAGISDSTIVFASTKLKTREIYRTLTRIKISCGMISSDLEQREREDVLLRFRTRKFPILVATDVVSRGIDIEGIGLIVNYDVPRDPEDYVHRIGRTARAEATGRAITLVGTDEHFAFSRIEKLIGYGITRIPMPAEYGEPVVYDPNQKADPGRKKNVHGSGRPLHHKHGNPEKRHGNRQGNGENKRPGDAGQPQSSRPSNPNKPQA